MILFRAVGIFFFFLALLAAARREGNVVYIPIPPDLSAEDVYHADAALRTRLYRHMKAGLPAPPPAAPALYGPTGVDMIAILVDHEGAPVAPDRRNAKTKRPVQTAAGALTFTYISPEYPWSAEEIATLQSLLSSMYPLAKEIYGPPAFDLAVNIRKDPTIGYAGLFSPSTNELVLRSLQADVVCHEMIHAFRDENLIGLNTYEEGMTRAAEVEVFNRLPDLYHWDRAHGYVHDVFYDGLNSPIFGSRGGSFYWGHINLLLHYQLSGYAWGKVLIENPRFLPGFNARLYAAALADPGVTSSEPMLLDIAAGLQREVEGQRFLDWYRRQGVLNTNPPTGYFLQQFTFTNDDLTMYVFQRDASGTESMQAGVPVNLEFYSSQGLLAGSNLAETNVNGWFSLPLPALAGLGRFAVNTRAPVAGAEISLQSHILAGSTSGIFGIVTTAETGSITITPLNARRAAVTVPLANGAFSVPALGETRGTFIATVEPLNGQKYSRWFTKDASAYFLYLDPR